MGGMHPPKDWSRRHAPRTDPGGRTLAARSAGKRSGDLGRGVGSGPTGGAGDLLASRSGGPGDTDGGGRSSRGEERAVHGRRPFEGPGVGRERKVERGAWTTAFRMGGRGQQRVERMESGPRGQNGGAIMVGCMCGRATNSQTAWDLWSGLAAVPTGPNSGEWHMHYKMEYPHLTLKSATDGTMGPCVAQRMASDKNSGSAGGC